MTEPTATAAAAARTEPKDGPVYSKDYWDLVLEQLAKRRLFQVGLSVLMLTYGIAIFAPFLANDRPYSIEGVDLKAYNLSLNALRSVVSAGIGRVAGQSDDEYLEELRKAGTLGQAGVPQTRRAAMELETEALDQRLDVLRTYLPPDPSAASSEELGPRAQLDAFEASVQGALTAFDAGDKDAFDARLKEAKDRTRDLKQQLRPLDPGQPENGGVALVAVRTRPLWDALSPGEVFFMVLWLLAATWPVWNRLVNGVLLGGDRSRVRRARRRKLLAVLGLSLLAALGWRGSFGDGEDMYVNAPYKAALTDGDFVLLRAGHALGDADATFEPGWAVLRYGLAETHTEEMFRPPTWRANAARDEQGRPLDASAEEGAAGDGFQASFEPVAVRYAEPERNAWHRHVLGVDEQGRDFLSRLIWGSRTSLTVGLLSAFLLTVIGVFFGAVAGFFGGWVDTLIMRLIEILQSIPAFFLILMTVAFIPQDVLKPIFAIVIVIAVIRWTGVARLVRGEFLRLREQEFVIAAEALGFSRGRTIFRHVLPNAMSPVLVSAAFAVAAGILTESAISFLGFGIKPPEGSWGSLVNESKNSAHWWIHIFPGILIFVTVTCYNLVGDAIRDALDPKMKV